MPLAMFRDMLTVLVSKLRIDWYICGCGMNYAWVFLLSKTTLKDWFSKTLGDMTPEDGGNSGCLGVPCETDWGEVTLWVLLWSRYGGFWGLVLVCSDDFGIKLSPSCILEASLDGAVSSILVKLLRLRWELRFWFRTLSPRSGICSLRLKCFYSSMLSPILKI